MSTEHRMVDTGALTDLVIAALEAAIADDASVTAGKAPPVGDNVAPAAGGWANGQPGSGVFVPYLVVVTGGGAPRAQSPGSVIPTFSVSYSLRSHGGSRAQCDWMAKVGRDGIYGVSQVKFGDPLWKVINVEWQQLGPMLRNDSTAPPSWSVSDTFLLVVDS